MTTISAVAVAVVADVPPPYVFLMQDMSLLESPGVSYLDPDDVVVSCSADMGLSVEVPYPYDDTVVPMTHTVFDTEGYFVSNGMPFAFDGCGVNAAPMIGVGDVSDMQQHPDPSDLDWGDGGSPQARWLPLEGTFDDGQTWAAWSGDARFSLLSETTTPFLDTDYAYRRGQQLVPSGAMVLRDGEHLWSDQVRWVADDIMVAMVAVLRPPEVAVYGLLETVDSDMGTDNTVGLRFDGAQVLTIAGGQQSSVVLPNSADRAGCPVIVGFWLQISNQTLSVFTGGTTLHHATFRTPGVHSYSARLYVGNAPDEQLGTANMDILDLCCWTGENNAAMYADRVSRLVSLYGIGTS